MSHLVCFQHQWCYL